MLSTPNGDPANDIDRIMLLFMWGKYLEIQKNSKFIIAGIGKPSFPININVVKAEEEYWTNYHLKVKKSLSLITNDPRIDAAISYGNPQGDEEARLKMAKALTRWYSRNNSNGTISIAPQHILFTVGGSGALRVIFHYLKKQYPNSKIITPSPYYTLYAGLWGGNNLYPIDIMQESGYLLTSERLKENLKLAKKEHQISALLICDPNNPVGTVIDKTELIQIAKILKSNPNIYIILDEAYAEMCFEKQHISLLSIAPELQDRIILIRSGTKALSAAGERMGVIVTSNQFLMTAFIKENISSYGHAPRSLQHAFAEAIDKITKEELEALSEYYKLKVDYVSKRLKEIGAEMPDSNYKVKATFYIMGDFSDLLGLNLPPETKKALNKTGKITTDEDIVYYLLFIHNIMLAPLSYFGVLPQRGYLRITCSGDKEELKLLMDKLDACLKEARERKQKILLQKLHHQLNELKILDKEKHDAFHISIQELTIPTESSSALQLKATNLALGQLLVDTKRHLARLSEKYYLATIIKIQAFFRSYSAKKIYKDLQSKNDSAWSTFLDILLPNATINKSCLFTLPRSERRTIPCWNQYLNDSKFFEKLETKKIIPKL